jgi:amino acid transporter
MVNKSRDSKTFGFLETASIGIGGMVGGGIFAVLGLAVQLSKGGTPVAFLIAGLVALVTTYSYMKLSIRYPSRGGTVEFIYRAFGSGITTGTLNILLWLSYIVMLSLYAYAFGSYGSTFFSANLQPVMKHVLISSVVIIFTLLNILGSKIVGRAETYIVAIKIIILLVFIFFGIKGMNTTQLQPSNWSNPIALIGGGMVIFVAYEGFELIANSAGNISKPKKILPRAYFVSVIFVIALYISISIITIGNLSIDKIVTSKDYALAEAAKPFLGSAGFILITIAALLSTSSAINATLYGSAKISYVIAKEGELPVALERLIWNKPIEGLIITSGLTLIIANLFDLSNIAMMGSSGFLIIFAAVNLSNIILSRETRSFKWLSILGFIICLGALIVLLVQQISTDYKKVFIPLGMILISFLIELAYRKIKRREIKSSLHVK